MKTPKTLEPPRYPVTIETYADIAGYALNAMAKFVPSCFNGVVSVKRYRITVEEIDEPQEVIAERLQKLWDESDNHHHYGPLKIYAQAAGIELIGDLGRKRVRK